MKKRSLPILALALALTLGCASLAAAATADEAKAMVQQAIAMAKDKGLEATYAAIRDKNGPFFKGELYIFVCDINTHVMLVHPEKPVLEGKDQSSIKDVKGKLFFLELARVAKEQGSGWVDYHWAKPGEKEPSLKTSYVERVPGSNVFFGCGFYK
ncbi:MAG: cache domain-containing protein [Desulfarculus sp.]|nr:cache domain-containing protein [Desulfarculus sp.]